jgi:carbon monoxide dehydrogenase subunit G
MNLKFIVNKPISDVITYLTDTNKFVSVHPVITKLEPKGGDDYLVYETLKMGFIPFSFTYPVVIKSDTQKAVVTYSAVVKKTVRIEMHFQLSMSGNQTIIEETTAFKSFLPVKFIMSKIFKKQHSLLFKNIEKMID